MEHRLLTGGYEFLPFARSRVAMLKKLGLPYADQSFEIDGVSIKVRIEPGHEHIRIDGSTTYLKMESGVAYLLSVTPVSGSDAFTPGILHETQAVAAYNALFTKNIARKDGTWRTNPGKASAGQVSGELVVSNHIKGYVPLDKQNSRAFAAGEIEDTTTDPTTWTLKTYDEVLFNKKMVAEYAPASIFTGRCRLYVQAMYGQYLYPKGLRESHGEYPSLQELPWTIDAPSSIKVRPYKLSDGDTVYSEVHITTSSGVYLDPTSGKHWLLNIEAQEQITVYPLKSNGSGERLRYLLKTGSNLSATDREHLEAYILGCSLPDVAGVQYVKTAIRPGIWSLGYGWHWNYSGTCADMVENTTYAQDNEPLPNTGLSSGVGKYKGMESTHCRVTVALAKSDNNGVITETWSAAFTVVSGPSRWSAPAGVVILTEVDWATRRLIKIMPRYTIPKNSSATFYAFYLKDELQLCTVSNTVIPPKAAEVTYSDIIYYAYGTNNSVTVGMGGGWLKNTDAMGETYEGTVTCGGVSAPYSGFGKSYYETEVGNKQETGFSGSDVPIGHGTAIFDDWNTYVGYPPYTLVSFPYNHDPEAHYWAESVEWIGTVTFDRTTSLVNETQGAYCIFVPPINDSQAGYLLARTHNIKYKTGRVRTNYECFPGGGKYVSEYRSADGNSGPLIQYTYCSTGSSYPGVGTAIDDLTTDDVISEAYKLVCGAGVIDVKTTPYHPVSYALLTFEDDAPDAFETRTSVGGALVTVDKTEPHGLVGTTDLKLPAFVGWA